MSRTKEKQRTAEVIERELVEVRARLEELRTELRGLHDTPAALFAPQG